MGDKTQSFQKKSRTAIFAYDRYQIVHFIDMI